MHPEVQDQDVVKVAEVVSEHELESVYYYFASVIFWSTDEKEDRNLFRG